MHNQDTPTEEEKVFALKRRTVRHEEFRATSDELERPEPRPPLASKRPMSFDHALDEVIARFRKTLDYLATK
jgi:hypothetical protein